ncbi:MAG: HEPN domain-containing protein [Oscillospiraceae bacterium]|nr:HEPN domain-containing protein [Oscillospiraceae bacterium]
MDEHRIILARYRLEKALNCIEVSKLNLDNDFLSDSVNRSYYAIFYAARAIMALDGIDRKKHSGVISYFQESYIKTGIFTKELSNIIQDAFNIRQITDYQDFFVMGYDDAVEQLKCAEKFCSEIKIYIEKFIGM